MEDSAYLNSYGGAFVFQTQSSSSAGLYLAVTLLQQMLAGGVIYGWQALMPVLYDYGVFASLCEGGRSDPSYPCLKMRSQLATVFSVAGSAGALGALFAGLVMDFFGTRAARLVSAGVVLVGAWLLASAGSDDYLWFPGLACLGFGGNGIQITSFHVSNLFLGRERLVVSMITGSFAASSFLFTLMRMLYERANVDLHVQFGIYSLVCLVVVVTSLIWPTKPFTSPDDLKTNDPVLRYQDPSRRDQDCDASFRSDWTDDNAPEPQSPMDPVVAVAQPLLDKREPSPGASSKKARQLSSVGEEAGGAGAEEENLLCIDLSAEPLRVQLRSPEWIGLLAFFLFQLNASTFYLTAVGDQLHCWACGCAGECSTTCLQQCAAPDAARGNDWLTLFGIIFPLGFITSPICGFLQDRYPASFLLVFVNACFVIWQIAAATPSLPVQMITLIVSSSARQFLFSFFFASEGSVSKQHTDAPCQQLTQRVVAGTVGSIFGYSNFGFLTGLANGISAVCLLANAPLYTFTASHFTTCFQVFAALSSLFFAFAWLMQRRLDSFQQQRARREGEWSREASQHGMLARAGGGGKDGAAGGGAAGGGPGAGAGTDGGRGGGGGVAIVEVGREGDGGSVQVDVTVAGASCLG